MRGTNVIAGLTSRGAINFDFNANVAYNRGWILGRVKAYGDQPGTR